MSDPFTELAMNLRGAQEFLDGFDPAILEGFDREDLVSLVRLLDGAGDDDRGLAGRVSLVLSAVKSEIASRMESDLEQIGDFLIERRWGKSRSKWDHKAVWADLSTYVVEQHGPPALEGLDAARTAAPSPSWTSSGLRKLSLDPDAYCEPGDVRASLIIRRHIEEAS